MITILQHRKPVQQLEPPYYSAITIMFQWKMDSQIIGRLTQSKEHSTNVDTYGAYKRVDKKIKPVSQRIPPEFKVTHTVPYDLLTTLVPIDMNFLDPEPTQKFTQERIDKINNDMLSHDFLSPEERKLFLYVLIKNEAAIAFVDEDCGTLKESYFSPYKIHTSHWHMLVACLFMHEPNSTDSQ